ncbi:hypothetical protein ACFWJL_34545, partial [Streptomyces sp. NPDC127105]
SPPQTPLHTTRDQPEAPLDIHRGINAVSEAFLALLKEEIGTRRWPNRSSARADIFAFVETFYNRQRLRRNPRWGYLTPLETRQRLQQEHAPTA